MFDIIKENEQYILYHNWIVVNFSIVNRMIDDNFITNKNIQCKRLLKKFNIKTVFSIVSKNKSDLELFSKFLENRCLNE